MSFFIIISLTYFWIFFPETADTHSSTEVETAVLSFMGTFDSRSLAEFLVELFKLNMHLNS